MAATKGRTAAAPTIEPTPTELASLTMRQPETKEVIRLEIFPPTAAMTKDFISTIDALEKTVDKTVIAKVTIRTPKECESAGVKLVAEKEGREAIIAKIERFATLANRVHKAITGKRAEYVAYYNARIKLLEAGIADWTAEQERIQREEEERLRAIAQQDERERLDAEGRADEPVREIAVSVDTGLRRTSSGNISVAKGVSVGKAYAVDVLDEEKTLIAAVRPIIYREIAAKIRKDLGAKGERMAAWLDRQTAEMPQIPLNIFEAKPVAIKKCAEAVGGRMNWPGVAVSEVNKTRSTRR